MSVVQRSNHPHSGIDCCWEENLFLKWTEKQSEVIKHLTTSRFNQNGVYLLYLNTRITEFF